MVLRLFPHIHNPQPAVNDDSRVADNGHHHLSHHCLGLKQNKQSHQHHPHSSHPPTCIIILSSMRSDSVGIAGHLGPIPPVAGKLPKRDHLQLGTSSQHPVFGLNWPPHSSLIALHASDSLWPPNPLLPICLPPPLPSCQSRSSSQEFTFSAFDSP